MLLSAHKRTCASNLQVTHGNAHATAQILELVDCGQTLSCLFRQRQLRWEHKVRVCLLPASTNTALELVQLSQSQALRILDNQRVRMRVVNAGLNDGGGHQYVNLMLLEGEHDVFYLASAHLAVSHAHTSFRSRLLHASHCLINSGHAVGHVVHLTFSLQLTSNSCGNKVRIVLAHHHLNRLSARRWRQNQAHVTHATHGHLHGARNRRCRKR